MDSSQFFTKSVCVWSLKIEKGSIFLSEAVRKVRDESRFFALSARTAFRADHGYLCLIVVNFFEFCKLI